MEEEMPGAIHVATLSSSLGNSTLATISAFAVMFFFAIQNGTQLVTDLIGMKF